MAGRGAKVVCRVYCLSILLIFLCNFVANRQMMLNGTQGTLQEQINYYESVVLSWVDLRVEHINILKNNFESMTEEECTDEAVLRILTDSTNYGISMGVISDYLVYPDGKMLCGDGWAPESGYDPTQNDYYRAPAGSGETFISLCTLRRGGAQCQRAVWHGVPRRPLREEGALSCQ